MRSTNGSNAFTDTNSKHRKRRLRDPDNILGFAEDGMSDVERPAFQRDLTKEDIERILKDNPELAAEFDNERERWLELGEEDPNNINPLSDYNALLVSKMQKGYDNKADDLINNFRKQAFNEELAEAEKQRKNELQELEMDRLEMMGQAVAFANSEGMLVRKKIKQKKKAKKKSKVFILDTPYGKTKYFKRKPSPKAIEENNVMFQNQNNLTKKQKAKAKKLHGDDDGEQVKSRSGSSIVEGDEVMFENGFGPNKEIESDGDEMDEADMVFYQKDDMTNFSKNLGINKLKSRLSLMNFRKSQDKFDDNQLEFNENSKPHYGTANNFSPGPVKKFIQKKPKGKKRKNHSINNYRSPRMNRTISIRSAISSIDSVKSYDSDDQYTSEEDNPNDRSGLLSFAAGKKNKNKRIKNQTSKKKNQWVDTQPDKNTRKRKLFRNTGNLSLVLPRLKNRMKRSKVIRRKKRPSNIQISSGSPYEEYLPARFKDYKVDDFNSPAHGFHKMTKDEQK